MWVDFQPTFHTHLVQQALALLPPFCPIAKGKCCMFMFVFKVLDSNGPGPSKPWSFFTLPKKRNWSLPQSKKASAIPAPSAPPPPPLSGPPPSALAILAGVVAAVMKDAPSLEVLPLPLKHGNTHADKSTWDHGSPSLLSTLTPSPVMRPLAPTLLDALTNGVLAEGTSVKKNLSYFHLFLSYPQNKRNKM